MASPFDPRESRVSVLGLSAKRVMMPWSASVFKFDRWNDSLFCHQNLEFSRPIERGRTIYCEIRFDDNCRNGKNSFAITGHIIDPSIRGADKWECAGCIHEEIGKYFPELAHMIKWHVCDTSGPMHYPGSVTYHAGDRDCWGLLKGESRQIINGRSKMPCWKLRKTPDDMPQYIDAETRPEGSFLVEYDPLLRVGEGKERDLKAARSCAVWPDAPDDILCLDKAELEPILMARLPILLEEFRADVESLGFYWSAADYIAKAIEAGEVTA